MFLVFFNSLLFLLFTFFKLFSLLFSASSWFDTKETVLYFFNFLESWVKDKYKTHFLFLLISVLALESLVFIELRVLLYLLRLFSCNLLSKCLSKFSLLNLSTLYVKEIKSFSTNLLNKSLDIKFVSIIGFFWCDWIFSKCFLEFLKPLDSILFLYISVNIFSFSWLLKIYLVFLIKLLLLLNKFVSSFKYKCLFNLIFLFAETLLLFVYLECNFVFWVTILFLYR